MLECTCVKVSRIEGRVGGGGFDVLECTCVKVSRIEGRVGGGGGGEGQFDVLEFYSGAIGTY